MHYQWRIIALHPLLLCVSPYVQCTVSVVTSVWKTSVLAYQCQKDNFDLVNLKSHIPVHGSIENGHASLILRARYVTVTGN
jgi:hypothetical protein